MSDIFISYSSKDRARAKVLAGALEHQGWSVWWDRKIPPGRQFSQVIKEAMDEARCIIVLWSKESVKSEWVQNEAAEGARRKILVPALIDDVEIPFEFRRVQAARLVDWEGRSPHPEFDVLLEALCAILGQPLLLKASEPTPDEQQQVNEIQTLPKDKPKDDRRMDTTISKEPKKLQTTKMLAAICIVTLIAIISTGIFLKYRQPKAGDVVTNSNQNGAKFEHIGRSHSTFKEFYDEPDVISKGPITKVKVCYGDKYIYGLQLWYGGHEGKRHGFCDESFGLKFEPFDVPDSHLIVRVKGVIAGDYVGQLQFETDRGTNSKLFGGNQTPTERFMDEDPNGLPLRTISGWANPRRGDGLSRAITSITFHFGS